MSGVVNTTRTAPVTHTSDAGLAGNTAECFVCGLPARVIDGPILQFANPRNAYVCIHCARAIKSAT